MDNAIVLKPAEDTSLTALVLARLAEEARFPPGVFNVVTGLGEEAGAALSAHPGIGHISFTGSREVGTLVRTTAAKNTVPVTLELGGKSPQVVFSDAPIEGKRYEKATALGADDLRATLEAYRHPELAQGLDGCWNVAPGVLGDGLRSQLAPGWG